MLAVLRALAVLLQGIWFIQIAQILFKGALPPTPAAMLQCVRRLCMQRE